MALLGRDLGSRAGSMDAEARVDQFGPVLKRLMARADPILQDRFMIIVLSTSFGDDPMIQKGSPILLNF
jgi:hypothetical protein